MQTFLPYSDFRRSAAALDLRRLGKQRVETLQILRALTFDDYGWRNHPAVTMWTGFTQALVAYGVAITQQWQRAAFSDTVQPKIEEFALPEPVRTQKELVALGRMPPWIGSRPLHRSHQAALVRKDPGHYAALFPRVDPDLPYVWPPSQPPALPTGTVSAWVVRLPPAAVPAAMTDGIVGVEPVAGEGPETPAGAGTRNTKRRRQITAFFEQITDGDRVVVPVEQRLLVAEVSGGYEWRSDGPAGLRHIRTVRWIGEVHRSQLVRPVHLQDPRLVFALRNEPGLAGV